MWNLRRTAVAIALVVMGLSLLWMGARAQSGSEGDDGPIHHFFLPLLNSSGEPAGAAQEEDPAIVDEEDTNGEAVEEQPVTAAAAKNITISLRNPSMDPFFGIQSNSNHGWITSNLTSACDNGFKQGTERPKGCDPTNHYRAWIDGPMNPYKYGSHTYFQIPHAENYRIKVPNHAWGNRPSWTMEGDVMPSRYKLQENLYNNRHWLYSVRNVNGTLYGLTHHEWYLPANTELIGGIPFLKPDPKNLPWITSIGWATSSTGGTSWQMKSPDVGSARLVVVPEPSATAIKTDVFGFSHPSNIVKSGSYYYFFTSSVHYKGTQFKSGVSLFRSSSINRPTQWQYWNGSGWTTIDHSTYQGNFGRQMPYIFWATDMNDVSTHLYALNVRYHTPSRQWIVLGSSWCDDCNKTPVYSWTGNLASPTDLEKSIRSISNFPSGSTTQPYFSFFEVSGSADDNYQNIGNQPLLVVGNSAQDAYLHQFLSIAWK